MTPGPALGEPGNRLGLPHHDGSPRYVSNQTPRLGDWVTVLLRVPRTVAVDSVYVRTVRDGEQHFVGAREVGTTAADTWWSAELECHNRVTAYRWLISGTTWPYAWLNGTGLHTRDVADAADFRLVAHDHPAPTWTEGAVVYQVFPDRFARSAAADTRPAPDWAIPKSWDEQPEMTGSAVVSKQFYGGDLDGVVENIDHVAALGADAIYLTPIFPARSNHRYDATDFDTVDPLLGGDPALRRLTRAAHEHGLKVIGDLTTNHCGDAHPWFVAARAPRRRGTPVPPERDFFYWDADGDYVGWLGVRSLPKFNHASAELRRRLVESAAGPVRKWLGRSGGLDGWRIDVANMTGRQGAVDLNHEVARSLRDTMDRHHPGALLIAEHGHDYTPDLTGDGWHGVMNYLGFCKPVWTWLARRDLPEGFLGSPMPVPNLPGDAVVATMREVTSQVAWQQLVHSFNLLGSHDTARIHSLVGGDPALVEAGAGLLLTMPGIAMITYGDEIGMPGLFGEDGRRPMPWDEHDWDHRILTAYRELVGVRRQSVALRTGGLRWVYAGADALVFLRECETEVALVHVSRAAHDPVRLRTSDLPGIADGRTAYGPNMRVGARTVTLRANGAGVRIRIWTPTDDGPSPRRVPTRRGEEG